MPQTYEWDRRLFFPSEGMRAEDFFALKIRWLWPGLNPQTWVLKASTLPLDHRSHVIAYIYMFCICTVFSVFSNLKKKINETYKELSFFLTKIYQTQKL